MQDVVTREEKGAGCHSGIKSRSVYSPRLRGKYKLAYFQDVLSFLLFRVLLASSFFFFFFNPQHPCVHDEVTGVSLLGLPALQALLYHCRYFQHVALCASGCYQGRRVFHSQPCADAGGGGLFPPENTLLGRSRVKPITRCQQGSPSEISSCPPPIRFRGLFVVLEERPAGVRRQPQEAFQLALHVQHDGQWTPHLHTFNTAKSNYVYSSVSFILVIPE